MERRLDPLLLACVFALDATGKGRTKGVGRTRFAGSGAVYGRAVTPAPLPLPFAFAFPLPKPFESVCDFSFVSPFH
jgi:hypothetical protein